MIKPKPVLLFDIDGTLIDTGGRGGMAFNKTGFTAFGIENGTRDFNFAGATDLALAQQFLSNHGFELNEKNQDLFLDTYAFWLDYFLTGADPAALPGVKQLLPALKILNPDLTLGLLTGNTRLGAEIKLRHYGIWHHFSFGAFGCEHHDRNEIASLLLSRMQSLGPIEITLIGDTLKDLEAAKTINARFVGFCSGKFTAEDFAKHGADLAIHSYESFPVSWFRA